MKTTAQQTFRHFSTLFALSAIGGCMTGRLGGAPEQIRPPVAYVSPNMDFTKIGKVGVFPLFPGSNPASLYQSFSDDQFSESLVSTLTAELQTRQSQWNILGYKDIIGIINKSSLGSGYKNLQADLNTSYAGPMGALVLSAATKKFMADMQKNAGVDAFLLGTYGLTREPRAVGKYVSLTREVDVAQVRLVLLSARDGEAWWTATVGRYGDREGVVREIAQSLAANLGKGTLRQME